jgi:ankyrin repeat protein
MYYKVQKQLLHAAGKAKIKLLDQILSVYGVTDVRDNNGNTPLILAARNGNNRTVQMLLEYGADIHATNNRGENALILACREAHLRLARLLLEKGGLFEHHSAGNEQALAMLHLDRNSILKSVSRDRSGNRLKGQWFSDLEPSSLRLQRVNKLLANVIKLLITFGADVNAIDKHHNTLLNNIVWLEINDSVRLLLEHGADPNIVNDRGESPLFKAMGHESTVTILLKHGANPNVQSYDGRCIPVHALLTNQLSPSIMNSVIAAGVDVNSQDKFGVTPLHIAVDRVHDGAEMTRILLDAGADPMALDRNGYSPAEYAMMRAIFSHIDNPVMHFDESYTHLICAAKHYDRQTLMMYIADEIPAKIITLALMAAINNGQYESCQFLLNNGADPNGIDIYGTTPLCIAADLLDVEIAKLLLNYGAKQYASQVFGQHPLHFTCQQTAEFSDDSYVKRLKMAKLLLKHGADANGTDEYGTTPLHLAVYAVNDIELVRLLLHHGAKPDSKNYYGETPISLAERDHSLKIANLIEKYMTHS